MPTLSKSKYQAGLQCPRQLWLQCNRYRDPGPVEQKVPRRMGRSIAVECLEWGVAARAMVDPGAAGGQAGGGTFEIDAAFPAGAAAQAETLGIERHEHGLGTTVAELLLEVSLDREAPVMPDHGGGMKSDPVAGLDEAPTEIDVVASGPELFVESADVVEGVASHRKIAARQVLGFDVVEQHVRGASRSGGDHGFHPGIGWRGNVGATRRREVVFGKGVGQPGQPIRIGFAVVVGVNDDLAG